LAERGDLEQGHGTIDAQSPRDDYLTTLGGMISLARRLTVVVDAGNGVAGLYAPELLRRIGCEVVELHCESDGRFPHHLPDPEDPANVVDLQARVVEVGADLGIAYDGVLASCKVIETAAASPEPIGHLFDSVPHLRATPELKAPCPDGEKFRVIEELTRELKARYETIDTDGARVLFPGGGWGLVRASNTNPYLTLRFEARTDGEIEAMKRVIYDALRKYPFVTLPD